MRSAIATLALALVLAATTPKSEAPYAAGATGLWDRMWPTTGQGGPVPVTVTSPDGRKTATATYAEKQDAVLLEIRAPSFHATVNIGPGVQSAVEWSPDSKAFFVTTSDQGANGWYHTFVYSLEQDSIKEIDSTPLVLATFGHPVKCGWPEDPNVGAITWLSDSEHILLAAEIMAHTNCDSYGTFKAYEVALPELRIVKSYDQLEAKKLFHNSLGWEIEHAPDKCIRDPKSCWVEGNHSPQH